jgi:pimeloyl-ACP methyl ester carboxylesterase
LESYFVNNGDVKIHVLDNGIISDKYPPLLIIGGLWEPAERAIPVISALKSRAAALSLRGRGLSSTPKTGYDLVDHLSDIEAVLKNCGLKNYCVLGFSRGASYALGWSLYDQHNMRGLILVDQPPVHLGPEAGYAEYWANLVYQGVPLLNFMRREALEGIEREAKGIDFSPELPKLRIPVKFFAGRNSAAKIESNVTDEDLENYKCSIPGVEIVEFKESGHMIPDDEREKYIEETDKFIRKLGD